MKVLISHNHYQTGSVSGEDVAFENESTELSKHIEVVKYEEFNDDLDIASSRQKLGVAANAVWSRRSYKKMRNALATHRPDIAHFHNTFPQISPSAYQACQDAGVPVIQTIHNYRFVCPNGLLLRNMRPCELCLHGSLVNAVLHKCYRGSALASMVQVATIQLGRLNGTYANKIDRYIVLSEFVSQKLNHGGIPRSKIVIKPNFVTHQPSDTLDDNGYALFVGRLSAEKGVEILLDAWSSIEYPLVVVGDGALKPQLEAAVLERGLNVQFKGAQTKTQVHVFLAGARMLLLPSICFEGAFPLVAIEAFAHGVPVVGSDIGCIEDGIDHGATGLLFEAGSAQGLRNAVTELLNDSDLRARLSTNCREEFTRLYSVERNIEQLLAIYTKVLDTATTAG